MASLLFNMTSPNRIHLAPYSPAKLLGKHILTQVSPRTISIPGRRPQSTQAHLVTKASWTHPIYTTSELQSIQTAHRNAQDWSDKMALGTVRFLRWGMDLVTGYRHSQGRDVHSSRFRMTEQKWVTRFIFLESVAGVPGMVAAMLRHLKSLRRMRRDYGWIETLLEEAYNERMHLLTFLKLSQPGPAMYFMVLAAQCVFFTGFSFAYLISPRICHRFVGYLEEEAVITYTKAIQELDKGNLPLWSDMEAPAMAIKYWQMPEGQRSIRSLLLNVRADEANHRDVNHTLGCLNQDSDPNPFSAKFKKALKDASQPLAPAQDCR
ncbi:alternative oxidase-domain-containing protein [Aspergillus bertholletiae]|uniref:Alternative oxidase n=1 Tax=Aspergillus bertholletiae TaxID=1226010 RepID=A0A5N7B229_9EURO|nr:alternative oxidase-domain-containing protein [Aspergillus bertholletiae]